METLREPGEGFILQVGEGGGPGYSCHDQEAWRYARMWEGKATAEGWEKIGELQME